jgi:hypothetical protein
MDQGGRRKDRQDTGRQKERQAWEMEAEGKTERGQEREARRKDRLEKGERPGTDWQGTRRQEERQAGDKETRRETSSGQEGRVKDMQMTRRQDERKAEDGRHGGDREVGRKIGKGQGDMRKVMQTIRGTVSQAKEQTGRQSAEKHLVLYNIYLSPGFGQSTYIFDYMLRSSVRDMIL